MKKSLLLLSINFILLFMVGCGYGHTDEYAPIEYTHPKITKILPTENTIRYNENIDEQLNNDDINSKDTDERYNMYELTLIGKFNPDWKTDGNDVIYNNIRYIGLNSVFDNVELPCHKYQITKFILESFKAKTNTVYCDIEIYGDNLESSDSEELINTDDNNIIHDELSEWYGYNEICYKHNDQVSWILNIYEDNVRHYAKIYGCKSFLACTNIGKDRTVDLSEDTNEN